jgi:choice-of-anchor C domain-containing protein
VNKIKTFAVAALFALAASAHAGNLVTDGTFAGGSSVGSYGTYNIGDTFDAAWTVTGGSIDLIGSYWTAPTGYSIDLDGSSPGAISQTLNLAAGTYLLTFDLAGNPDGGSATKAVAVSSAAATQDFSFVTTGHGHGNMGWVTESMVFTVTDASVPTTLTFASKDASGPYGAALADISVTAVPEPASLGFLLAGIGMFGVMSSRRNRNRNL